MEFRIRCVPDSSQAQDDCMIILKFRYRLRGQIAWADCEGKMPSRRPAGRRRYEDRMLLG